jgi:predicted nuclease of predicted toxin-antitoxin system
MRLLLDANLSPRLIEPLTASGYDVTHVGDLGLLHATDSVIFDRAVADGYVIVTADSDFPMLVALRRRRVRR